MCALSYALLYYSRSSVPHNSRQDHAGLKLNSFGIVVDLTNYLKEPSREESVVERLLDDKNQIQSQLRDISSESNEDERNLSRTLGEHQMQFLTHFRSIQNVQEQRGRLIDKPSLQNAQGAPMPKTPSQVPPLPSAQHSSQDVEISCEELASSRQVSRLKEIMETNLKILQDQIDWNHEKIQEGERVKEQGTSMTPIRRNEKSTSMSGLDTNSLHSPLYQNQNNCQHCGAEDLQNCQCRNSQVARDRETYWLQEALFESYNEQKRRTRRICCLNCYSLDHTIYECGQEGDRKRNILLGLQYQESLLNSCRDTPGAPGPREPDQQRLDAIAMTRKIANPSGRNWGSIDKSDGHSTRQLHAKSDHRAPLIKDKPVQYNSKVNVLNTSNIYSRQDNGIPRTPSELGDGNSTPVDKRTLNQPSQSNAFGQTKDFHRDVIKRNRPFTEGEQLPSNRDLRPESTSHTNQPCVNYSHKTISHDIKDPMTHDSQATKQLVLENNGNTAGVNDNKKKNVQFRDERETQFDRHKREGHDPILITPRHPPTNGTLESSKTGHPYGNSPPNYPLENPEGRYFSGTVENGRGGDFHGYYFFPSNPMMEPIGPARIDNLRLTSTPYFMNGLPDTPKGTGSLGGPPCKLFLPKVEDRAHENKFGPETYEMRRYYREGPPNYGREPITTSPPTSKQW